MAEDDQRDDTDRHINLHFAPEQLAGVYSNFANVNFSDYEFTITFARVEHEVDEGEDNDGETPGVVVQRVSVSHKFMGELIEAMQTNYARWQNKQARQSKPSTHGRRGSDFDF